MGRRGAGRSGDAGPDAAGAGGKGAAGPRVIVKSQSGFRSPPPRLPTRRLPWGVSTETRFGAPSEKRDDPRAPGRVGGGLGSTGRLCSERNQATADGGQGRSSTADRGDAQEAGRALHLLLQGTRLLRAVALDDGDAEMTRRAGGSGGRGVREFEADRVEFGPLSGSWISVFGDAEVVAVFGRMLPHAPPPALPPLATVTLLVRTPVGRQVGSGGGSRHRARGPAYR